jgi:L-methionine (R)-S-oxide reductase
MYDFAFDQSDSAALWEDIRLGATGLVAGESDAIANMANVAALLWQTLPDLNWAGFYRFDGTELVLGPFQGKAACIRIPLSSGVCGAAARTLTTQRVDDVHAFPGHIACDADSRSELVVPVVHAGRLIGVIDLDSPKPSRFGPEDAAGCEALAAAVAAALAGEG